MKICSFNGSLPASSNGPSCTVFTVSVYGLARVVAENNVLATRSLRQLRLGGIAVVLEPASSRRKANRWRLSICSRR